MAAHLAQLRRSALVRAGLAQRLAGQVGHLVRADDDSARVLRGHRMGFGQRQAQCQVARGFVGQRGFVYVGGAHAKGQVQAL